MTCARLAGAVLALCLGILPVFSEAQVHSPIRIDLSKAQPGNRPEGFSFGRTGQGEPGEWKVLDDPSVPGGKVIAQTSGDTTDYRFPLAIYDAVSSKNVAVALRFKPVGGKVDQAGGIAVRLSSPDNYYVVRANALEDNVRFYRVANGSRQQLAGADAKVAGGVWHMLALRAEGEQFTVTFDGKELFSARDATIKESGKVALWTKADSITHFDSIAIGPLP
jgi:hypothetical protein